MDSLATTSRIVRLQRNGGTFGALLRYLQRWLPLSIKAQKASVKQKTFAVCRSWTLQWTRQTLPSGCSWLEDILEVFPLALHTHTHNIFKILHWYVNFMCSNILLLTLYEWITTNVIVVKKVSHSVAQSKQIHENILLISLSFTEKVILQSYDRVH